MWCKNWVPLLIKERLRLRSQSVLVSGVRHHRACEGLRADHMVCSWTRTRWGWTEAARAAVTHDQQYWINILEGPGVKIICGLVFIPHSSLCPWVCDYLQLYLPFIQRLCTTAHLSLHIVYWLMVLFLKKTCFSPLKFHPFNFCHSECASHISFENDECMCRNEASPDWLLILHCGSAVLSGPTG